ncbi:MAG: hypothetical protein GY827_04080 [Cytophagales bacterium]|nr:hypothetical protein [Cytophagales bacterium]
MNKNSILLILLTFLSISIAQNPHIHDEEEKINQKDKKGRKQGEWHFFDEKEEIFVMSNYKNDLLEGNSIFYKKDKLLFRLNYSQNQLNGVNEAYKKGHLVLQVELKNNKLDGALHKYKGHKKQIQCIQNYKNHKREGEAKYFKKGKLFVLANFQNNKLHGLYTEYYPATGKKKIETTFENGIPTGIQNIYDKEGNKIASKTIKKGLLVEEISFKGGKEVSRKNIKERITVVFSKEDTNKLLFKNMFHYILPH